MTLDELRRSHRRIAIIGKFSWAPGSPAYVFAKPFLAAPGTDAALSAAEFYRFLRPHLYATPTGTQTIGRMTFNKYTLAAPARAVGSESAQPVLSDSPLLDEDNFVTAAADDGGTDRTQKIQEKGSQLFRRLLKNLDVVARFSHPNFTRALLALAGEYLLHTANPGEGNAAWVDDLWKKLLSEHYRVASALVRFLTCYGQDDEVALTRFRALLKNKEILKQYGLDDERVNRLADALAQLKDLLAHKPLTVSGDPVWADLTTKDNFPWLLRYPDYEDYFVPGAVIRTAEGEAEPAVGKTEFRAYYREFRRASDEIHRFVRTPALHSYLFCWLASKYRAHALTGRGAAADRMYEIAAKQPGHVPGESYEERERNRQLVEEHFQRQAPPVELAKDENFKIFRRVNQYEILNVLESSSAFTRKDLQERLKDYFAALTEIAVGEATELAELMQGFNQGHKKFYQRILLVEPAQGAQLTVELFREALLKECDSSEERQFVEALLKDIAPQAGAGVRGAVKEAFIRAFTRQSDEKLVSEYQAVAQKTKPKVEQARQRYRMRLALDIEAGEQAAGTPAVTLVPFQIEGVTDTAVQHSDLVASAQLAIHEAAPAELTFPVPPTMPQNLLQEDRTYKLVHDKEPVASLTRKGPLMTAKRLKPETAPLINSDKTVIQDDKGQPVEKDGQSVTLVEFRPRGLDQFSPPAGEEPLDKLVDQYAELDETMRQVVARYRNDGDQNEITQALRRLLRAMLLGEYMLAAPRQSIYLNTADLSQVLGVMLDMTAELGDDLDDTKEFLNKESDRTSKRLSGIQLNKYFPVADNLQMRTILRFHYSLCEVQPNVRDYLAEIRELVAFFASAAPGTEVVFVNATLKEHNRLPTTSNLVFCQHKATLVYLTRQAFSDRTTAAQDLRDVLNRLAQQAPAVDMVWPVFVAPFTIVESAVAAPVIQPTSFPLPRLVRGRRGRNEGEDATVVDRVIQTEPYLLLCGALASAAAGFGTIAVTTQKQRKPIPGETTKEDQSQIFWDVTDRVKTAWQDQLHVTPVNEQSIAALLHEAWFAAPAGDAAKSLFGCLFLARLLTLALDRKRRHPAHSLRQRFVSVLAQAVGDSALVEAAASGRPAELKLALQALEYDVAGAWRKVQPEDRATSLTIPLRTRVQAEPAPTVDFLIVPWLAELEKLLPETA
jgi:hypothetical protein